MDDLEDLLNLHGETFPMDNGYWVKFEAHRVESSSSIPHGVKYSLTLHDKTNQKSDIDLLYDIDAEKFCLQYPGFSSFSRLKEIKQELKDIFHTEVDLATIDNPSKIFREEALKDAIYV